MAKTKGTNLIGAVKFLRKNREAARAALPPRLHHYLDERALPTLWYPEEDLVELLRAMAPLIGYANGNPFELMGRLTLREHMEGVYERLLKGDPLSFARRVSALWQMQHDSGRLTLHETGPHQARYELDGYDSPSREMCATIHGYLYEALCMSGFGGLEIRKTRCTLDGDPRCIWECAWEERALD